MTAVTASQLHAIASRCERRWDRIYSRIKLATDPAYQAVAANLASSPLPLLDIGCGMGLLAHYLRATGHTAPITGLDFDDRKIAEARFLAAGDASLTFHHGNALTDLPDHHGDVVMLDMLQYFTLEQQTHLLREAARRLAPGGQLLIRNGLHTNSWRYTVTRLGDWFARLTFWMKASPTTYPSPDLLNDVLGSCGLTVTMHPLWGSTPFNNYLIVASNRASQA